MVHYSSFPKTAHPISIPSMFSSIIISLSYFNASFIAPSIENIKNNTWEQEGRCTKIVVSANTSDRGIIELENL